MASSSEPVLHSRRSLYVGGLSNDVNESSLRAAMIPFGPIQSIEIPMDYASGKHKGFAFVEYGDAEDAHECIYNLDGSELYGRVLSVNLARENRSNNNSNKAVWSTDEFFQTLHDKDQKKEVEGVLTEEGVAR